MLATLKSEQIKLTSTRGWWIAVCVFVFLSIGFMLANVLVANVPSSRMTIDNSLALSGVMGFGFVVLATFGTLAITSEYRYRTIHTTFQATPNRYRVMMAKAGVLGVFAALLGLSVAAVSIALAGLVGRDSASQNLGFTSAGAALAAVGVGAVATVVGSLGIGALLRSTAAAVSVVIVWATIGENMLTLLPRIGLKIAPWLPFNNLYYGITGESGRVAYHWGQGAALGYFCAVALVLFAAGTAWVARKDS